MYRTFLGRGKTKSNFCTPNLVWYTHHSPYICGRLGLSRWPAKQITPLVLGTLLSFSHREGKHARHYASSNNQLGWLRALEMHVYYICLCMVAGMETWIRHVKVNTQKSGKWNNTSNTFLARPKLIDWQVGWTVIRKSFLLFRYVASTIFLLYKLSCIPDKNSSRLWGVPAEASGQHHALGVVGIIQGSWLGISLLTDINASAIRNACVN